MIPSVIFGFLWNISRFVDHAVAGGYVLALALVCLMQYVLHLLRMAEVRRQYARFQDEVEGLETELSDVQKDRALAILENSILREFVAQTELDKSLDLILRRYVPNPREGFSVLLQRDGERCVVQRSRGLSDESVEGLQFDRALWQRLSRERSFTLDAEPLRSSELAAGLSNEDRGKARSLHVIAVGDSQELIGAFVATALYPTGATNEQQIELARRLMISVAGNLRRSQTLAMQEHQLRSTSEMLELRGITDRQYEAPVLMLEAFVNCLRTKVGGDRAALYLSSENTAAIRPMVRSGATLPPHILVRWQGYEDTLAEWGKGTSEIAVYGPDRLEKAGIDTLVGQALVLPLSNNKGHFGVLSLTRQQREVFTPAQLQLVTWAGEHLVETIVRVLNQAAVEKQARQDGLTELANRRTFDNQIEHEISTARRTGVECSLLLFDLDRFKSVNDTYGHLAGDEVLRQTARLLREQVMKIRSGDRALIARYGGEEIAVLLPGIGHVGALRIAETIRMAIEAAVIPYEKHELRVTISAGLATFPENGRSVQELIAAADAGLYRAKSEGRNRVVSVNALEMAAM